MKNKGFTLIELLVVISIIGILAAVVLTSLNSAKEKSYFIRAKSEFRSIETALELYKMDHNSQYPDDATRDVAPAGFSQYIGGYGGTAWPKGPWPRSLYDWDNWQDPDDASKRIYQISLRFCSGDITTCRFPKEPWAANFDIDSAVYYCVSGSCRSHQSHPIDYPGYCVNCN